MRPRAPPETPLPPQKVMEAMGVLAIVVNCYLLGQCGQLQRLFPWLSPEAAIVSVVVLEVLGRGRGGARFGRGRGFWAEPVVGAWFAFGRGLVIGQGSRWGGAWGRGVVSVGGAPPLPGLFSMGLVCGRGRCRGVACGWSWRWGRGQQGWSQS